MIIGNAMRALAGIWMMGTRPMMFRQKMNEKSVSRNGRNGNPAGPAVSMMIPSRTKPIADSATPWMPVGTSCFLEPATR